MNALNAEQLAFWNRYLATLPDPDALKGADVSASMAGDERNADELLQLYLEGKKTAGSSLVKDYEVSKEALPAPGKYWMILDGGGRPRCLVKTVRVETHRFDRVPEAVAIAEGEGDLSLEYWRKEHHGFFAPYLERFGISDLETEDVITEFFEVVYQEPARG